MLNERVTIGILAGISQSSSTRTPVVADQLRVFKSVQSVQDLSELLETVFKETSL